MLSTSTWANACVSQNCPQNCLFIWCTWRTGWPGLFLSSFCLFSIQVISGSENNSSALNVKLPQPLWCKLQTTWTKTIWKVQLIQKYLQAVDSSVKNVLSHFQPKELGWNTCKRCTGLISHSSATIVISSATEKSRRQATFRRCTSWVLLLVCVKASSVVFVVWYSSPRIPWSLTLRQYTVMWCAVRAWASQLPKMSH